MYVFMCFIGFMCFRTNLMLHLGMVLGRLNQMRGNEMIMIKMFKTETLILRCFLYLQCNSSFRDMLIERLQKEIQFLKSEIERIKFEVDFFFQKFKMKS